MLHHEAVSLRRSVARDARGKVGRREHRVQLSRASVVLELFRRWQKAKYPINAHPAEPHYGAAGQSLRRAQVA